MGQAFIVKGDKFSKSQCSKNDLEKQSIKQIPYVPTGESLMYTQVCTN